MSEVPLYRGGQMVLVGQRPQAARAQHSPRWGAGFSAKRCVEIATYRGTSLTRNRPPP